jgi:hypothetical protein
MLRPEFPKCQAVREVHEKGENFEKEVERSILYVQIGELGNLVHQFLRTVDGEAGKESGRQFSLLFRAMLGS